MTKKVSHRKESIITIVNIVLLTASVAGVNNSWLNRDVFMWIVPITTAIVSYISAHIFFARETNSIYKIIIKSIVFAAFAGATYLYFFLIFTFNSAWY